MRHHPIVRAVLVVSFALALALGGSLATAPTRAGAQTSDLVPPGAVDGAGRAFLDLADPVAPGFLFSVYAFDTPEAARSAEETLNAEIPATGQPVTGGMIDGTPVVGTTAEDASSARLDGLVDSATVYTFEIAGAGFSSSAAYLLVRQGPLLFIWAEVVQADAAGVPATPSAVGPDQLVSLATGWFSVDHSQGELIDQLPTVADVPAGYTETLTARTLDELGGAAATPAA